MNQVERYKAFVEADRAWSENLNIRYGKNAGDMRYRKEAKSVQGYAEFARARDEWARGM